MNAFLKELEKEGAKKFTENGAVTYSSSLNAVLDLFALGGAYRSRTDAEVVELFTKAMHDDLVLATQCLFYLRDVRGGQGERRFFRIVFPVLLEELSRRRQFFAVTSLIKLVAEYGRFDDLLSAYNNPAVKAFIIQQFTDDVFALKTGEGKVSLLAKWMPSIDASSKETVAKAKSLCKQLAMRQEVYRKHLSALRKHLDVVERKMSANEWGTIEYSHVPSQAMLRYKNAFAHHDAERFAEYIASVQSGESKINAGTLYPHQLVEKAASDVSNELDVLWNNLPSFIQSGRKILAVADVSGSMYGGSPVSPICVSIALALYTAEHNTGAFENVYMTFSKTPRLIHVNKGASLHDKVQSVMKTGVGYNTDVEAVFDLLLRAAVSTKGHEEDFPDTVLIISDMEFDKATEYNHTNFDGIKAMYKRAGVKMPTLVFWNVSARNDTIPVTSDEHGTVLVSGFSPVILKQVFTGMTPVEFMVQCLNAPRYKAVAECFA